MQGRVVFMDGGEATPAVRTFLERQPQPVLEKPFARADVQDAMERLGIRGPQAPATGGGAPVADSVVGRVRPT
jgi:hypothetical protein